VTRPERPEIPWPRIHDDVEWAVANVARHQRYHVAVRRHQITGAIKNGQHASLGRLSFQLLAH
jgi:hypothetical protein